jgi:hypothetical protein
MVKRRREALCAQDTLDIQEIKMNASLKAPMSLGFILAIPLFALPALGAPTHEATQKPAHHQMSDFTVASGCARCGAEPVAQAPETDGLSRKDEECNMGCIDH